MRKKIFILAVILSLNLPIFGAAQDITMDEIEPLPKIPVKTVLERVENTLFGIFLIMAAIFLVITGYFYISAQGDPTKYDKAKKSLIYAIIGIIVAIAARGIVEFIKTMLGAD